MSHSICTAKEQARLRFNTFQLDWKLSIDLPSIHVPFIVWLWSRHLSLESNIRERNCLFKIFRMSMEESLKLAWGWSQFIECVVPWGGIGWKRKDFVCKFIHTTIAFIGITFTICTLYFLHESCFRFNPHILVHALGWSSWHEAIYSMMLVSLLWLGKRFRRDFLLLGICVWFIHGRMQSSYDFSHRTSFEIFLPLCAHIYTWIIIILELRLL